MAAPISINARVVIALVIRIMTGILFENMAKGGNPASDKSLKVRVICWYFCIPIHIMVLCVFILE